MDTININLNHIKIINTDTMPREDLIIEINAWRSKFEIQLEEATKAVKEDYIKKRDDDIVLINDAIDRGMREGTRRTKARYEMDLKNITHDYDKRVLELEDEIFRLKETIRGFTWKPRSIWSIIIGKGR